MENLSDSFYYNIGRLFHSRLSRFKSLTRFDTSGKILLSYLDILVKKPDFCNSSIGTTVEKPGQGHRPCALSERITMEKILDRYVVLEKLGSGGNGVVYKVMDLLRGQVIALKMFSREGSRPGNTETLYNEFKLLSELEHPHLVEVYDFGTEKLDTPFFTMEYLRGKNVIDYLASANFEDRRESWNERLSLLYAVFFQIGEALVSIHSRNIIHGDLKPSNILVMEMGRKGVKYPHVKLLDFGLGQTETDEKMEILSGTLEYMAPEFFSGEGLYHSSDLYATGVIMYEILTGKPLIEKKKTEEMVRDILTPVFPPPSEIEPRIDHALEQMVMRLLRRNPLDRYENTFEFLEELSRLSGLSSPFSDVKKRKALISSGRFAGRKAETETLDGCLGRLMQGENGFVLLSGDLGIGKSSLLKRFKARGQLAGVRVLRAFCREEGVLQGLADIARQSVYFLGRGHDTVQRHRREIESLVPSLAEDRDQRIKTIHPTTVPFEEGEKFFPSFREMGAHTKVLKALSELLLDLLSSSFSRTSIWRAS